MNGHDEPCYYCKEPCSSLAANPGMWPIGLCHVEEPGKVKWHHSKCVSERLENWRLLTEHGYMNVLGSAGFHSKLDPYEQPYGDYRHFGINFWTEVRPQDVEWYENARKHSVEFLLHYIDVLRKLDYAKHGITIEGPKLLSRSPVRASALAQRW